MRIRMIVIFCLGVLLCGCALTDRGMAKLEVLDELKLGMSMDEVKVHWYQYSIKPLQVDTTLSKGKRMVFRGVSRDVGVTSFYMFFDVKSKILREAEWRYRPSMVEIKERELLETWTKKLWKPSVRRGWGGKTYVWGDRKAELSLYIADGICHLRQRLK